MLGGALFPNAVIWSVLGSILCSILAGVAIRRAGSTLPVFIVVAMVSMLRYQLAMPGVAADSVERLDLDTSKPMLIVGSVATVPAASGSRLRFRLACDGVYDGAAWRTVSGEISARIQSGGLESHKIEAGQQLLLEGRLQPRLFPGRERYEVDVVRWERLDQGMAIAPLVLGERLRRAAEKRLALETEQNPTAASIYKALTIGIRGETPREVMDTFRRTGSLHIFAISGLHVGIVGLLIAVLLKAVGVRRDHFWSTLLPLLLVFVVSTGMKSSALRAFAMAAVFLLSSLFKRQPDIPSSVSAAAIILLWIQPLELTAPGFVFSFTVVSCIVMVFAVAPKPWFQGSWLKVGIASLAVTSFAASLASAPLSALYFGTLSPIALLGNLIVVPLTFCIVLCGWLSILIPPTSAIFNHAALTFIDLLLVAVGWLDALPGSSWSVAPPSLWAVSLWFVALIHFFVLAKTRAARAWGASAAVAAVLLALLG